MELVESKENESYCDSSNVARKFKIKHSSVVKTIEKLVLDLGEIDNLRVTQDDPKIIKEDRVYRGAPYTAYLMNRPFFSLLCMRFKGKTALEWQLKFNAAFYAMERRIQQEEINKQDSVWLDCRKNSKLIRQDTTDVIKDFVEYATVQGSKSAKFYYKHVTNATYKALGMMQQRKPKLRDTLNTLELGFLQSAEHVAQMSIKKHMLNGYPYKLVYVHVCEDLERFAESLMLPKIK